MNKRIARLIEDISKLETIEDKCKSVEAYVNAEKQHSYYQARNKIVDILKEYNKTSPSELLSLKSILFLIK